MSQVDVAADAQALLLVVDGDVATIRTVDLANAVTQLARGERVALWPLQADVDPLDLHEIIRGQAVRPLLVAVAQGLQLQGGRWALNDAGRRAARLVGRLAT